MTSNALFGVEVGSSIGGADGEMPLGIGVTLTEDVCMDTEMGEVHVYSAFNLGLSSERGGGS